ncbi:hypothetical protein [Mobilicoccus massiliensis]|uniref:hypothetical protein n=1 Tax=Mobilicoccus massiliensis TaxID=1522310 RepID=UPI00058FF937|nr:hypothetical protein [Mobilicoccus massiliensis]
MTDHATADATGLVTLADVAVLAGVQRPVVSMWRKRPHAVAGAFPAPVGRANGADRFERRAVVEWLRASGRGNNPELALDAALHTRPPLPTPDGWALVTALLAVQVLSGETCAALEREDLLDVAEEADPDDRFAFSEIAVADEAALRATAAYVDDLVGAARGGEDALTYLRRDPSRFGLGPDGTAVAEGVLDLVGALAVALGVLESGELAVVADPTGCSSALVMAAVRASGAEAAARASMRPVVTADTESVRWAVRDAWRRLVIHGVVPEDMETDDEGHVTITGSAVVVAAYPHPGAPDMTPKRLLDAVDDVLVQLDPRQTAVIVGPASVLTDNLGSPSVDRIRHEVLSTGRLRALVRFGPGSSVAVPQRRLALWVIGPAPVGNVRQGRTAVVDLAGADLAEVRDDLVADIVAAIEDRPVLGVGDDESEARAHVFRVARYQRTFAILAERRDLVPRDLGIVRPELPPVDDVAADAVAARVASPVGGVAVRVEAARNDVPTGGVTTVRELIAADRVTVVPGTRLSATEVRRREEVEGRGVPITVMGVPELSGDERPGERVVDLLAFTAAHPKAHRTEAGDVLFCTGPRPGAWVDARGGTVVEFPARSLRVQATDPASASARVIPHVLAADLARGKGTEWRSFPARLVSVATADTLTEVFESITVARAETQQRVDDLDRLTQLLADGAVAGRITAMMNSIEPEGH